MKFWQSRRNWRERSPARILLVGCILSCIIFIAVWRLDEIRIAREFAIDAQIVTRAINKQVDGDLSAIKALRAMMEVIPNPTANDFDAFAGRLRETQPSLLALEWLERIPLAERPQFEAELGRNGAIDPWITEGTPGAHKKARIRQEYIPVRFLYPRDKDNSSAIGYDMASCAPCRAAMDATAKSDQVGTMSKLRVLEQNGEGFGVPMVLAAKPREGGNAIQPPPPGFAMVLLQVRGIVERALSTLAQDDIDVEVYDENARSGNRFLYRHRVRDHGKIVDPGRGNEAAQPTAWLRAETIPVGNRRWRVVCLANPDIVASQRSWTPWLMGLAGLLCTLVATSMVLSRSQAAELQDAQDKLANLTQRMENMAIDSVRASAVEKLNDGYFAWEVETGKAYHSPRWLELLGYTEDDETARIDFFRSLIHPEDRPRVKAEMEARIASSERREDVEMRVRHKHGHFLWVSGQATVMERNKEGTATYVVGTIRDISERKAAEEKLLEEKCLAEFAETVGVCLTTSPDLKTALQGCCDAMGSQLGVRLAGIWRHRERDGAFELVAGSNKGSWSGAGHWEIRKVRNGSYDTGFQENIPDYYAIECQEPPPLELNYALRVGNRLVGMQSLLFTRQPREPVRSKLANAARVIALAIERAATEEALQESSERRLQVLEISLDAVVSISENGEITEWNPRAESLFGWTAQEAEGKSLSKLIAPPPPPQPDEPGRHRRPANWQDLYLNRLVELTTRRRDGTTLQVEATVLPVTIRGKRQFTVFIRDLTERKRLESELLQARKQESIGQLGGGIAHDFNNILAVISGSTELAIMKATSGQPVSQELKTVLSATARATELTRQLLAYSRRQLLRPEVVVLNDTVRSIMTILRRIMPTSITIDMDLAPDLWPVRVDPRQFEQVLVNLVMNSRDAMPQGGKIMIRTLNSQNGITLSVSDTGIGMDEATRQKIFDPFFTTKPVGEGSGLGLSVVFGVVKQSHGEIIVASAPGEGTTVSILLPCAPGFAVPISARGESY